MATATPQLASVLPDPHASPDRRTVPDLTDGHSPIELPRRGVLPNGVYDPGMGDDATITPIGDYGFIGDTRTGALVSSTGAIDWLCAPRFDSPPIFGALVAGENGGSFRICPVDDFETVGQQYVNEGTVLETSWRTDRAGAILRDALVANVKGELLPSTVLVRHIEVLGSPVDIEVRIDPVLDGRYRPRRAARAGMNLFQWSDLALAVCADRELADSDGRSSIVTVEPGRPFTIVLTIAHRHPGVFVPPDSALQAVRADQRWWRELISRIEYNGPWREAVVRSVLTLKLLTFSPSGAPVAAPTTSLPEEPGGGKNWDYRFAWLRDAALGVTTFLRLGLDTEARQFLYWLLHATRLTRPVLPPALTTFGNPIPDERVVNWPGYANSRPVRMGNVVGDQRQIDVYGLVLDAGWRLTDHGHDIFAETWRALRGGAEHVLRTWQQPGAGIWEIRGEPRQWVQSKMLAWMALDRAAKIGYRRGEPPNRMAAWEETKDRIRETVNERGYDPLRGTYVREYGGSELDGSLALLPVIGMEPPGSPRLRGTIAALRRELHAGGPLFYRHGDRREGAFLPVSFWIAEALAMTDRLDEAAEIIDPLVRWSEPLGLLPEEVEPSTGRWLGNYPQALSHAALLQSILTLSEAGGK